MLLRTLPLLLALATGCGQTDALPRTASPSPSREGEQWTHKELHEYLQSKGVRCHMLPAGGMGGDVAAMLIDEEHGTPVTVLLKPSARAAREHAAPYGQCGLAWGRFMIVGDADTANPFFFESIRAILEPAAK